MEPLAITDEDGTVIPRQRKPKGQGKKAKSAQDVMKQHSEASGGGAEQGTIFVSEYDHAASAADTSSEDKVSAAVLPKGTPPLTWAADIRNARKTFAPPSSVTTSCSPAAVGATAMTVARCCGGSSSRRERRRKRQRISTGGALRRG
jgi:hypothetical protein